MIRKDTESDWKWKETVCAYLKGCLPSGLCFSALVCGLFYVCTCTWNHIDIQMAYTTMNTRRLTRLWFYQCAGCGEMCQQDICHFWGLNYTSTCDSICEMSIQSPRTYHRAARNSQTTFRRHWEAAFPSTLLEHLVTLNFLWTLGERARTNRRFFETFITTRCIPKSIWSSNSNRAVDTGASPLSLPFTLPIAVLPSGRHKMRRIRQWKSELWLQHRSRYRGQGSPMNYKKMRGDESESNVHRFHAMSTRRSSRWKTHLPVRIERTKCGRPSPQVALADGGRASHWLTLLLLLRKK